MKTKFEILVCAVLICCAQALPGYGQTGGNAPNRAPAGRPPAPASTPGPASGAAAGITTPSGLAASLRNAEQTQNADALLYTYGQSITDPVLSRAALTQLLTNYYQLRNLAQTAEQAIQATSEAQLRFAVLQAAQNQVIIQQNQQLLLQNQRLLDLLERQSRTGLKAPGPSPPATRTR